MEELPLKNILLLTTVSKAPPLVAALFSLNITVEFPSTVTAELRSKCTAPLFYLLSLLLNITTELSVMVFLLYEFRYNAPPPISAMLKEKVIKELSVI